MFSRPFTAAVLVTAMALAAGACGSDGPPAPTTTTGTALPTRTTLAPLITIAPGVTTTTTTPAQVATSVDACGLVEPAEIALVVEDAGPGVSVDTPMNDEEADIGSGMTDREGTAAPPSGDGTTPTTTPGDADDSEPSLLLSACTWPSDGPGEVTLTYLAPTTATSAAEHLRRVIDLGTRFGRGARVLPLNPNGELIPSALLDADGKVLEVAVVTGSALVYVAPVDPPAGNSREANALLTLLLAAGRRAPG